MTELWDLSSVEGRRKAWEAGLLDSPPEEPPQRAGGKGSYGQQSKKRKQRDDLTPEQRAFLAACAAHGLPEPVPEYVFAAPRKWRFDWLWADADVALEIEGGAWTEGRHVRGKGYLNDITKYNEAQLAGFVLLRCTPDDVKSGAAFALVKRALSGETTGRGASPDATPQPSKGSG